MGTKFIGPTLALCVLAVLLVALSMARISTKLALAEMAYGALCLVWIIIPTMLFYELRLSENGLAKILLIIAIAPGSDIGGYFVGRAFGKEKLWPELTPKKTKAGAWGGIGVATFGSVLVCWLWLPEIGLLSSIFLGVTGGVIAISGDLVQSAFKRAIGADDTGTLLPGMGGLLDRADSILCVTLWKYVVFSFVAILG